MISDKMQKNLNDQINREMYSAFLYLSMATYANIKGFKGVANWFKVQYEEEMMHARKIYDYVEEQSKRVLLGAIDAPDTEFCSINDLFERALTHEKKVTGYIADLMRLAREESDFATEIFLQWFVSEQVEEESGVTDILDQLKIAGNEGQALMMLDKELGTRTFQAPAVE